MFAIHFATLRVLRYLNDISIRKKALQKIWQKVFQNGIQNVFQKVTMQSGKRISQSASGRELRHFLLPPRLSPRWVSRPCVSHPMPVALGKFLCLPHWRQNVPVRISPLFPRARTLSTASVSSTRLFSTSSAKLRSVSIIYSTGDQTDHGPDTYERFLFLFFLIHFIDN